MTMRKERIHRTLRRLAMDCSGLTPVIAIAMMCFVAASGCQAAEAGRANATTPDLGIGSAEFPDADAINLRFEQHWTWNQDGTVHRREHRWVKLMNSRPIRALADPRIDYNDQTDKLIIHTAQSHLPDGRVMPVPDYSFNLAGPDDVAGWPEYTGWVQKVVSYSGVMDGVVLELDYEVVTQPGVLPWIDADLRLDDDYPTVERVVSVAVPQGTPMHHRLDGPLSDDTTPAEKTDGGLHTLTWTFSNLPGTPAEPQSLPWQQRCPRLRFSTCADAATWVSAMLTRVEKAAKVDESIKKFAELAAGKNASFGDRNTREIAKKIGDSFNFVDSPKAMRSLSCRPAAEVLRANYGNPLEAAALSAAALRASNGNSKVYVAVDTAVWDEQIPTASAFAGVVVATESLEDETMYIHPQHGVFRNPGAFGKHALLSLDEGGKLQSAYIEARGENRASMIQIAGKIVVDDKGHASGDLRIHLTGAFYDPLKLEEASAQKALVKSMVGRALSDFDVSEHTITTLSDNAFRATAKVESKDALKSLGGGHLLEFGSGPAFLPEFPLPLKRSQRETAVHIEGGFVELVDLAIELPDEWSVKVMPKTRDQRIASDVALFQLVEVDDRDILYRRGFTVGPEPISPGDFAKLREAINELRTTASLHMVVGR